MDPIALLPPWPLFTAFLAAALALNLTPGADMAFTLARGIAQGPKAGVASALGIATGSFLHSLLAAFGVAALLAASETAFLIVKYVGAGYLFYLAVRLLLDKSSLAVSGAAPRCSYWRIYWQGTLVNLTNPKVALFILAFLPQFVDPARGAVAAQIILLGLIFNVMGTAINIAVGIAAGRAGGLLRGSATAQRALRALGGTLIGFLAIRLLLQERS